jgi:hypothetical protein
MSPRWLLPELDKADLHKLRSRELVDPIDLLAWNRLVINDDAASILEHSLRQAQAILLKAERLL